MQVRDARVKRRDRWPKTAAWMDEWMDRWTDGRMDGWTHLLDIGGGYEADLAVCATGVVLELCLPPAAWGECVAVAVGRVGLTRRPPCR